MAQNRGEQETAKKSQGDGSQCRRRGGFRQPFRPKGTQTHDLQTRTRSACSGYCFGLKTLLGSQSRTECKDPGVKATSRELFFSFICLSSKKKRTTRCERSYFHKPNFPSLLCCLHPLSLPRHLENPTIWPLHRVFTSQCASRERKIHCCFLKVQKYKDLRCL